MTTTPWPNAIVVALISPPQEKGKKPRVQMLRELL